MENLKASELKEKKSQAEKFAVAHVSECARELLELRQTGILCDGRVRELARICNFSGHAALGVAERFVIDEALKIAAKAK